MRRYNLLLEEAANDRHARKEYQEKYWKADQERRTLRDALLWLVNMRPTPSAECWAFAEATLKETDTYTKGGDA